ncbi:MAG TPA: succinyldiaminopimelate transaminase [Pseudomonadales bacterium]
MNANLEKLQAYPFERLADLLAGVRGNAEFPHIALSIGEPKHAPPEFVINLLSDPDRLRAGLGAYPATRGIPELREAISGWLARRYGVRLDPDNQVLPVAGTREALFSFGLAALSGKADARVLMPNPFYQIYEGAALLGNGVPHYVNCDRANDYQPDFAGVPDSVWSACEVVYLCSPGNPTGETIPEDTVLWLLEQADRHDFVVAADECYSEIYLDDSHPPAGLLEIAHRAGRDDYARCVAFHSLSKRSSLPGLRSGFVAGDAAILAGYFKYRTYEGCALPLHVQQASAAAWSDEAHVEANRALYRRKFETVGRVLDPHLDLRTPAGGFYHWLHIGEDDTAFARQLFEQCNLTVLPGSFLGRAGGGSNPGGGHVRVAWVASEAQCVEAAERLAGWLQNR